jgi:16S rRNA (guanine966-N2)-methyltransferase
MSFYLIHGQHKRRKLFLPPENITRPTKAQAREGLFNVLLHHEDIHLSSATVLDAFAGSGALGLEALSCGCKHVTFVEKDMSVFNILKKNTHLLGENHRVQLFKKDIFSIPSAHKSVDICFIDPPYGLNLWEKAVQTLIKKQWVDEHTWIILEMPTQHLSIQMPWFCIKTTKTYGNSCFVMGHITA